MKITLEPARHGERGYALVITLLFLFITLIGFSYFWFWTSTNGALTQRNTTFNQSSAAAEAATEQVFSQMNRDFLLGGLNTNTSYYATNIPDTSNTNYWPIRYAFSDGNGSTNQISVVIGQTNFEVLNSQYAGLSGIAIDCTNTAVATPTGQRYNVAATVQQTFQAAIIPVFQFAIFYNLNLEMACGQPQTISGPVFCNASIWEGSALLNFNTNVIAVGTNYTIGVDPFNTTYSTGSSANQGATTPFSGTPEANFLAGDPVNNSHPLIMPIGNSTNSNPTNVEAILNIPPLAISVPNTAGYYTTNQIYLYNESDLIISNAATGTNGTTPGVTNISIYYDDKPTVTQLTPNFYQLKVPLAGSTIYTTNYVSPTQFPYTLVNPTDCASNVLYAGWSFATNVTFYDYRERDTVQAVQIDIAQFDKWVTNTVQNGGNQYSSLCSFHKGHPIDSIWVYNSVPFSTTNLPAVRLANGQQLPSSFGLTVSTPMPAYIYGNYNVMRSDTGTNTDLNLNNTTYTYPAALLADAITILSTNWNDTLYTNGYPLASRVAADTTVNAAMLEGIVQTVPTINGNYSGGVENFLRLLEHWAQRLDRRHVSQHLCDKFLGKRQRLRRPQTQLGVRPELQKRQRTAPALAILPRARPRQLGGLLIFAA
jgi:hypothetical protein